jgi:deazaflavin-dependent oxidoreductase (nitroreductase family)
VAWSNRLGVWLYRHTSGRAGGGAGNSLVLTVPGRRTGVPRSATVGYLDTPDGYLVWGTAGGAPSDPDWFRNLRAASSAKAELGGTRALVVPRELVGPERDAAWAKVLAHRPSLARYEHKAGRTIPVALLVRAS